MIIVNSTIYRNMQEQVQKNKDDIASFNGALDEKQDVLVSGTNIKTINGQDVTGSGNLVISAGGATWGQIGGTLNDQTDLKNALDDKVTKVTGKQLSTEDYTTAEKTKLGGFNNADTYATSFGVYATESSPTQEKITYGLKNQNGNWIGTGQIVTSTGATSTEAGLMVSADKIKLDSMDNDIQDQVDAKVDTSTYNTGMASKQNTLVSGTNIKTINGTSLLGSGNIVISGGTPVWTEVCVFGLSTISSDKYTFDIEDLSEEGIVNGNTYYLSIYNTNNDTHWITLPFVAKADGLLVFSEGWDDTTWNTNIIGFKYYHGTAMYIDIKKDTVSQEAEWTIGSDNMTLYKLS